MTFVDASPLPWAGVTAKTAAWLRRESEDEFVAFSVNCAHLGLPGALAAAGAASSCAPATAASTTPTARSPPGPRRTRLTQYPVRVQGDDVEIRTDPIPIG